jgi:hypothetical protein
MNVKGEINFINNINVLSNFDATITGDGIGIHNINAENISHGLINNDRLTSNIVKVDINSIDTNDLLYYNGDDWCNLKIDATTLEITTDNKLTVIGGGSGAGNTVIINSNETTSNLLPPSLVETVSSGLIAHYKFDDSTDIGLDSSVGGIGDATPSSSSVTATTAQKIIGVSGAVIAQERLDLPNITFGTSNTISFWIKLDMTPVSDTSYNYIFSFRNTSDHRVILNRKGTSATEWNLWFFSGSGAYNQHIVSNVLENNLWYHIVISWNTTNVNMYFNNVLELNNQSSSHFRYSSSYTTNEIGKTTQDQINGYIDDFRIYNRALSAAEVEKLYLEGSDRGLIAHYKFDANSNDSSGNNYHLSLTNELASPYTELGFDNTPSSLKFDADTLAEYVATSSTNNLIKHQSNKPYCTISFWAKNLSQNSNYQTIWRSLIDSSEFKMYINPNTNKLQLVYYTGDWNTSKYTETATISTLFNSNWKHFIITSDGSNGIVKIREETESIYTEVLNLDITTLGNMGTGNETFTISHTGTHLTNLSVIDDFRIYDRVLSAAEIEKLYNSQYIQKRSIPNSTDEYIAFKYNPNTELRFVFRTDETPYSWQEAYDEAIANGGRMATETELLAYLSGLGYTLQSGDTKPALYNVDMWVYVSASNAIGKNAIQVGVHSAHWVGKSYVQHYPNNDIYSGGTPSYLSTYVEVYEYTEYTINFPQDTECEILLLDDTNYKHLETPLESLNGTYTVKVGVSESSISKSEYTKTTATGGTAISSGYSTDITGASQTYSSKEVIIRYATTVTITTQVVDPKLSSLSSLTPESNTLLYFDGIDSINYLELDPTTLEITADNKLKVIGGGSGTQVLIQNESDTITSNLEKPIIDSSNFVTDGLIAHYKFDGDLTDSTDPTNTSKNGTFGGTGGVASLNSTHKILGSHSLRLLSDPTLYTFMNLPSFQFGNTTTISFWFNWDLSNSDDPSYQKILFCKKSTSGDRIFISRDNANNRLYFTVDCDSQTRVDYEIFNTTINDNTWYYVVWVIDNVGTWKVYINGVYEAPSNTLGSTTGKLDTSVIYDTNYIGRHESSNKDNWDGYLDDFRIYDRVLSAEEIEKLYLEGSDRGLIAHYKFDDSTNAGLDSSGNGYDLTTNTGTPQISTTEYVFGSSSYLSNSTFKTNDFTFNNRPFSVSVWSYATNYGYIIAQHQASSQNQALHIQIIDSNKYRFGFYANDLDTAGGTVSLNEWVHLVFQIDSSRNREIWKNGVRIANDTSGAFLNVGTAGTNDVIIGNWNLIDTYDGYLDDFRIYDRALSAAEVEKLYNAQYIQKGSIPNSTDEYIAFKYNPDTAVSNQTEYTINFPQATECDILLLDDTNYKHLETPLESLNGTYTVKVGVSESSISNSTYTKTTTGGTSISSGYSTDIKGASQTYSSKEVIIRYKTQTVTTVTRSDPKLSSLSSLTPELNSLLYFNTSNSINYLELDPTTLEITTDNKLKVIGGGSGGGNTVIINSNETTSNLLPPSLVETVSSGLIAHYKFDDSTDIGKCEIDNAINNLTTASVSIVDGIINDAANFDGNTSYLKTSAIDLATTNVYSISFWVKFDTAPSGANQFFWSQGSTAGSGTILAFLYEQSNNCLTLSHYGVGNDINSSGYNMTTTLGTQWNFIVATYNESNSRTGEIYLDGNKLTTNQTSMTNSFTGTGDFYIAHSVTAGGTIDGVLDDFRIYDRALSAAEVEKLYLEGSDRGLISHYKFDGDLTDSTDPTNTSKNLTSSTAVTYNSDSIYGNSSYLYSNNYLTAPFKLKYLTDIGNFSISFWFRTDPSKLPKDTWNVLWSSSNYAASGADNRGLKLYLHSDNSFRLYTYQHNAGSTNYQYNNSISNSDTWVFLTTEFTYVSTSGNNLTYNFKLYLDNVLISNTGGSNNQSITFKTNDTEYLTIMDDDDNSYPNEVYLDDFRIYDRALSAAEVEKLYLEGSDRGLIAHYKFDDSK